MGWRAARKVASTCKTPVISDAWFIYVLSLDSPGGTPSGGVDDRCEQRYILCTSFDAKVNRIACVRAGKAKVMVMNAPCLVRDQHNSALRQLPIVRFRHTSILRRTRSAMSRTLKAFAEDLAKARRMAREYNELASMSDPELQDIGISRADIPAVVSGAYRRKRYDSSEFALRGRSEPSPGYRDQPCDAGESP